MIRKDMLICADPAIRFFQEDREESGGTRARSIIAKPDFVVIVARDKQGRVAIFRKHWDGPDRACGSLVTRGIYANETADVAAERALFEKFQIAFTSLHYLGTECLDATQMVAWAHYFVADGCDLPDADGLRLLDPEALAVFLKSEGFAVAIFSACLLRYLIWSRP